jgi:DNA-binding transcriptional LysR family regulator
LTNGANQQEDVLLDPRLSVPSPTLAHKAAIEGLGIAVLPLFLIRDDDGLVPVLPDWALPPVEFFPVYPERRLMAPKLRVFLDELSAKLRL